MHQSQADLITQSKVLIQIVCVESSNATQSASQKCVCVWPVCQCMNLSHSCIVELMSPTLTLL